MLSAKLGHFLDKPLEPIARRIRLTPNFFTTSGFLITVAAAVTIPFNPKAGGVLILVGGAFDVLDGVVARTNGKVTDFGAFLDSVLDRYSDAFLFLAIAWYMMLQEEQTGVFLSIGALVGAFLISYARARAGALGRNCHTGIMERPERIILISVACFTGYFLPVLWVLFVLTHLTVIQRILHVKRACLK
ncbi:MAG TPA: CDP-alcohol phosphatidyltransferase family protein [Nitrospirae bacterium]|nr:CDP-alcohol phosphatidyltransferase family protein [Nitrospirota bacterium]